MTETMTVRTSPPPPRPRLAYGRLYYDDIYWAVSFPLKSFDELRGSVGLKGRGWRLERTLAKNRNPGKKASALARYPGEKAAALDCYFDDPETLLNFIDRLETEIFNETPN